MRTSMTAPVTRRRVLGIGAVFAASMLVGSRVAGAARGEDIVRWRGTALGADASMLLRGATPEAARAVVLEVEQEIRRLEAIFSLYRRDSDLNRLNAEGALAAPPPDLLAVLSQAREAHATTGGLFDPTVQPLFVLFAEHYAGGASTPPEAAAVAAALDLVGFEAVRFDERRVEFTRPGMAMTLNGIAQGYVTDRIAALLRRRGFVDVVVDMGEIAASGNGPQGEGWQVGIRSATDPGGLDGTVTLRDRAIATSMAKGTVLDGAGTVGHIFHPRRGVVPAPRGRVSVVDESGARADALSTAAILMDDAQLDALRAEAVVLA